MDALVRDRIVELRRRGFGTSLARNPHPPARQPLLKALLFTRAFHFPQLAPRAGSF